MLVPPKRELRAIATGEQGLGHLQMEREGTLHCLELLRETTALPSGPCSTQA